MERILRLLVLVIIMMFGITSRALAQVPFDFHAPWMADVTADAGGAGSYYKESQYHDGYDQYCIDFNIGSTASYDKWYPVLAIADGTVTDTSVYYDYDVRIDHGDGYSSIYVHLAANAVTLDEEVKHGQVIGFIGNEGSDSGQSTGYHLHFCIEGPDGRTIKPSPMDGTALEDDPSSLVNGQVYGFDVTSTNSVVFDTWLATEITEINPYAGNVYNFLGVTSGDIHWWNGVNYDETNAPDSINPDNGDYRAQTVYTQDYDNGWCDGAIVYDALGGARSAYIIQCNQWDTWIIEDAPYIGPESFLGNPVTNVFKRGSSYYQLFQGGYLRTNPHGNTYVKSYRYGFSPGEMADGSWNPQISYRFAEEYESRGAAVRASWQFPRSGVTSLGALNYETPSPLKNLLQ